MPPDPDASPPGAPAPDRRSVRERRAERAGRPGPRLPPPRTLKLYGWIALALVAVVVVWAAADQLPTRTPAKGEKRIHRHATFAVFVEGEEVSFHHCHFDLDGCEQDGRFWEGTHYVAGHLHITETAGHYLHVEHPVSLGNLTLQRFFEKGLRSNLTQTRAAFDADVHRGRVVGNNGSHVWQLWVNYCATPPDEWVRVQDIPGYVPQQHDRILLTYGNATREELAPQMDTLPTEDEMHAVAHDLCPRVIGTQTSEPAPT